MKNSLIIAVAASVALAGCCCDRNSETYVAEESAVEVAQVETRASDCRNSYNVNDGGQFGFGERCVRTTSAPVQRRMIAAQPAAYDDCGYETMGCGYTSVQTVPADVVTHTSRYVVMPEMY